MFTRLLLFVISLLFGALAGWWLAGLGGAVAGIAASAVACFAADLLRGLRVVRWLREADPAQELRMRGLWGEVLDRARRALGASRQQVHDGERRLQDFLGAIQASPNGVLLLDGDGRIEWCNQTAATQLGIDGERDQLQLVGNLVRDPEFTAYYAGGDYTRSIVMTGRESTPARPVRISLQLHPYGEGRSLLLTQDTTAVEQAEVMRRDFVANVSHEIRTPLTVLAGFVETMQNLDLPPSERARYLELMARQAHRMQTLVSDLLTLSRLEGSPLPAPDEWIPVRALLAQCEQEASALSAALGKTHVLRFAPAPELEIAGSQSELQSALSNLASNAVRYTPAGASIEVRWTELADGRAGFSVQDAGPGIAAEHVPRLTERFYRVDRSRSRETGGTGLGLAIVKHVVQRHGGVLEISSTPGLGSTFAILFPASRLRPAITAPIAAPAPRATGSPAG